MNRIAMTAAFAAAAVSAPVFASPVADLRVVHASPDAPNVDVYVDGGLAFENLPFNDATVYASLLPGTYRIQVAPTGTQTFVIDVDLPVEDDVDYTVVAVNEVAAIEPFVLVDDRELFEDARVRFFHASPDAPEVDVVVADGGPVLFDDVEYLEEEGPISVAPGVYDLEVRVASTGDLVLELPGVQLDGGTVYSVFATGFAGGGQPALGALLTVDNMIMDRPVVEVPLGVQAGERNFAGQPVGDCVRFFAGQHPGSRVQREPRPEPGPTCRSGDCGPGG